MLRPLGEVQNESSSSQAMWSLRKLALRPSSLMTTIGGEEKKVQKAGCEL